MPINYIIDVEVDLLCTLFYGVVDKEDAFEYATLINNEPKASEVHNTLVLLKESELIFNLEDVEKFSLQLAKNNTIKTRDRIALLIESPADTVVATIFAQTLQTLRKGIHVELFYTLNAAIQFLGLSEQQEKIEKLTEQQIKQNIPQKEA